MFLFMILILLGFLLALLSFLVNFKSLWSLNSMTAFECGFEPFSFVRNPFSLHFFKLCLIFVIFDIEIIIILPAPMITFFNFNLFISMQLMILLIIMGLFFEWYQSSLNWF